MTWTGLALLVSLSVVSLIWLADPATATNFGPPEDPYANNSHHTQSYDPTAGPNIVDPAEQSRTGSWQTIPGIQTS